MSSINTFLSTTVFYIRLFYRSCLSNITFKLTKKIVRDPRTTLMIKNIPLYVTLKDLSNEMNKQFEKKYDFIHMPIDMIVIEFQIKFFFTK